MPSFPSVNHFGYRFFFRESSVPVKGPGWIGASCVGAGVSMGGRPPWSDSSVDANIAASMPCIIATKHRQDSRSAVIRWLRRFSVEAIDENNGYRPSLLRHGSPLRL